MKESVAFSTLLREAFHLLRERSFHWRFLLLIGFFSATSYFVTGKLPSPSSLPESDSLSLWLTWLKTNKDFFLLLFSWSLIFSLLQGFIRGALILTLEETLLSRSSKPPQPHSLKTLLQAGATSFLFEGGYFFISLLSLGIISLPLFFSLRYNENTLSPIFEISFFLFLASSLLFFFIKEYALYYTLLGRISIRSSLDLGYLLFRKNFSLSLLFGSLILGLFFAFTFILDSAMLGNVTFFHNSIFLSFFFIFCFSGGFGVFREALRLLFFHSIAADKNKKTAPEKVSAQEEISETPA